MSNYYSINPRFYISVDCIIFGFNEGCLLYTSDAADE